MYLAELLAVDGKVMARRAGSPVWFAVEEGARLCRGDSLKTFGSSSATIAAMGTIKVGPMSEITVDGVFEKDRKKSEVISVIKGGLWLESPSTGKDPAWGRTIIEAAGAVMDTEGGNLFIEVAESGRVACTDVFSGDLNVRTFLNPEEIKSAVQDTRMMFEAGQPVQDPEVMEFGGVPSETEMYSCLPELNKEGNVIIQGVSEDTLVIRAEGSVSFGSEGTAAVSVESETDGDITILVTAAADVEFSEQAKEPGVKIVSSSDSALAEAVSSVDTEMEEVIITQTVTVTFTAADESETSQAQAVDNSGNIMFTSEGCRGAGQQCIIPEDCCSGACSDNVCVTEEIDEFETLIVTTSSTVSFTCSNLPKIENLAVNGQTVKSDTTTQILGGECDTAAQAVITWEVTPVCGSVVAHTVSVGDTAVAKNGVSENETLSAALTLELSTEDAQEIKITVSDNFNNENDTTFKVQFKKHENADKPPAVTSVVYGGEELQSGQTVEVSIDDCVEGAFTISGTAAPVCGDIASVAVTQDSSALSVSGTAEWSAQHKVAAAEGKSTFTVTAEDSGGRKSDPFSFSISYAVDEALLAPPSVTSVSFEGGEVASGGSAGVTFEQCDGRTLKLTGTAAATCADISSVVVTRDDVELTSAGQSEWSAEYATFEEGESKISVVVTDTKGKQSDPYTFTVAHEIDDALKSPPVIESVSLSGDSVSDGDTVESTIEDCGGATLSITGSASAACAEVTSVWVKLGSTALSVSGASEWETQYMVQAQGDATITIGAMDSKLRQGEPFSFTVTHNVDEALLAPPSITSVTFNGEDISDGGYTSVTIEDCNGATLDITGTAYSVCGEIASVSISKDDRQLETAGGAEWSSGYKVNAAGESTISVVVVENSGEQGEPFTFTVNHEIAEELLVPPTIQTVMYGEFEVMSGDAVLLPFEECGTMYSTISGTVTTPCGDLATVTLTRDGEEIDVTGLETWTAADQVEPGDEAAAFVLTAADSGGNESDPFEFTVEPDVERIPMPEVELETVAATVIEDLFTPVTFYRDDLESGQLVVRGGAYTEGCAVESVEVSLDGGGSWEQAEGTDAWSYGFEPSEDTYYVVARVTDSLGRQTDPAQSLELTYIQVTNEEELEDIFHRLIQAYIDKDSSTFMELTSTDFSSDYEGIYDSNQLETSLDNKFAAIETIELQYSVDSVFVSGDTGQVVFSWNANPSTVAGYPYQGVFEFVKDSVSGWQFSTVDDDNTFLRYTSEASNINVTADSYSLTADTDETTTVYAAVMDSAGNYIADDTDVSFFTSFGSITGTASTADGIAEATFDANGVCNTASIYARSGDIISNTITIAVDQTPDTVNLDPAATILTTNVEETTTITAEVLDASGNEICDGKQVVFTTDAGVFGNNATTYSATTSGGTVQVTFNADGVCTGICESVDVTISATAAGVATSDPLTIEVRRDPSPDPPGKITLFASNSNLTNVTDETTDITAEVRDMNNNLISDGTEVEFYADFGYIDSTATTVAGEAVVTYDAAGVCTGACTSRTVTIYAVSGNVISKSLTIEVDNP